MYAAMGRMPWGQGPGINPNYHPGHHPGGHAGFGGPHGGGGHHGGGGGGHHGGGHHGGGGFRRGGWRGGWGGGWGPGWYGGGWGYPLYDYVDGPTIIESAPIVYAEDPNDPGQVRQLPYAGIGADAGTAVGGALVGGVVLAAVALALLPAIVGGYLGYKYVPQHHVLGAIGGAIALPIAVSVLLSPFVKS